MLAHNIGLESHERADTLITKALVITCKQNTLLSLSVGRVIHTRDKFTEHPLSGCFTVVAEPVGSLPPQRGTHFSPVIFPLTAQPA